MKTKIPLVVIFWVVAVLFGKAEALAPTLIVVTTTNDELFVNGNCSLREAIQAVNAGTRFDQCRVDMAPYTIIVPAGVYTLDRAGRAENGNAIGDLDIAVSVTIRGEGIGTTIVQAGDSMLTGIDRVLHITNANAVVKLNGMTIRHGQTLEPFPEDKGGGIFNNGQLTLVNMALENNTAYFGGGISNARQLTILHSTFSANAAATDGGAIFNTNRTTITSSTFIGNTATGLHGGAIFNNIAARIEIANGTFTSNRAQVDGGAIFNFGIMNIQVSRFDLNEAISGLGGALANNGSMEVSDTTVDNNSANYGGGVANNGGLLVYGSTVSGNTGRLVGGGVYNSLGDVWLINMTISGNSSAMAGGIFTEIGDVTVINATILNNQATSTGGIVEASGTVAVTNSLIANNSSNCFSSGGFLDNGNNLTDTSGCEGLPPSGALNLDGLRNNGGATETHALLSGSAALNGGNPAVCLNGLPSGAGGVDQRGAARDPNCDIGAYEMNAALGTIELMAVPLRIEEGEAAQVQVRVNSPSPVTVFFSISGSALRDVDYDIPGWTEPLVFGAGNSVQTFTVRALTDPLDELEETVIFRAWFSGSVAWATDEAVTITIGSVLEGAVARFDPIISKTGVWGAGQIGLVGEQIIWTVTVENVGGVGAQDVIVRDDVPSIMRIESATVDRGTVRIDGQEVIWEIGVLEGGEQVQMVLVTTIEAGSEFINTVEVRGGGQVRMATAALVGVRGLPKTGYTP